ncbi:hypothetical protein LZ023_38895 (plasmid) [Pseudomonas silvicola]|nr:hypothetical protein LZ023_38895 [Pseudomonas silvicola]
MLNCSGISRSAIKGYPQSAQFDGKRFTNAAPRQPLKFSEYMKMFWDLAFNKPKETAYQQQLPGSPSRPRRCHGSRQQCVSTAFIAAAQIERQVLAY